ncbi:transposase [Streptomyces sp. MT29]|nr:transposase [Streptomyces sp. MT29]
MPVPAWLEGRGGQPEGYCHRSMLDAIRYLVAGGISWRAMPADFWSQSSTTGCVDGSVSARVGMRSLRPGSSTRSRCGRPPRCRLPRAGTTAGRRCRPVLPPPAEEAPTAARSPRRETRSTRTFHDRLRYGF